ncbi:hypothetical protein BH23GEM8_BH23GEM8_20510 [soil metagenome]
MCVSADGGVWVGGFGIRDSAFGIRDSAFGIRDSAFGIRHSGGLGARYEATVTNCAARRQRPRTANGPLSGSGGR